jgi:hypothetical protein
LHATPRRPRVASYLFLALAIGACGGDSPTSPKEAGVRAVVGAGVTDTVDTQLVQALVVEVRGSGGTLKSGTLVRFEAQPSATNPGPYYEPALYVCALAAITCGDPYGGGSQLVIDTTDAQGRVLVTVRLGHVAGRAVVRLVVPEFGLQDSATFTVLPGRAKRVIAQVADTMLDIGATATLRGEVVDRYDNPRPEATTLSVGPGTAIAFDAATGTVTGRDMGTQWLFTRYTSLVDSIRISVVPTGRILVWSSLERVVRIVNLNGSNERTIISNVSSSMGAFPRFDPTRRSVTLHAGDAAFGEPTGNVIVVDTTGSPRRDIGATNAFDMVIATRQLADGTVLVVGQRSADASHPGYSVWRVATDNAITFLAGLPNLGSTYGGADISHNGAKVVYVATPPSSGAELRLLDVSSGVTTLLDASNTSTPRWSAQDDRVAYLVPTGGSPAYAGSVTIINVNGSGRRAIGSFDFSPGISWSPDGTYIIGRASDNYSGLRVLRLSDGANITLRLGSATQCCHDYWQPDWR